MNKKLTLILFGMFFFSISSFAFSEIVECSDLLEAQSYIDEKTHVLYEIDEILLEGTTVVSRTAFFDVLKEELLHEGYDPDQIANKLYASWVNVHKLAEVNSCGPDVDSFIESLNSKQIPAVALTNRGPRLAYRTLDQLHAQELYFNLPPEHQHNHLFEDNLAIYFEGMLFIHPVCNKGEYLLKLLDYLEIEPEKIVCIDHELIHLVHLQQALDERGINFTGIYLNRVRSQLTDWDIQIGKLQLQYLEKILPNNLAKSVVDSQEN